MAPDLPSSDETPPPHETAHEQHTRELEHSLEVLEETVEHGFVRVLKPRSRSSSGWCSPRSARTCWGTACGTGPRRHIERELRRARRLAARPPAA